MHSALLARRGGVDDSASTCGHRGFSQPMARWAIPWLRYELPCGGTAASQMLSPLTCQTHVDSPDGLREDALTTCATHMWPQIELLPWLPVLSAVSSDLCLAVVGVNIKPRRRADAYSRPQMSRAIPATHRHPQDCRASSDLDPAPLASSSPLLLPQPSRLSDFGCHRAGEMAMDGQC